jgi:long-subunit acyl-CoA synthetase (AMP-forming)
MGAGLPSPFAVAVLSDAARRRCADPGMHKELEDSICRRLEEVNAQLESHERIAFVAIVDGPWTTANGLMTPTLKLRRTSLEEQYLAYVDAWKKQGRPVVWQTSEETATYAGSGENG